MGLCLTAAETETVCEKCIKKPKQMGTDLESGRFAKVNYDAGKK